MPHPIARRRFPYPLLYAGWITLCAGGFVALRDRPDPSRRVDRMLSDDAAARAVMLLRQRDSGRFAQYDAVHVAFAGKGEGGDVARWIVLCDRRERSALHDALVVELDAKSGVLLRMRDPVPHL